VNSVADQPDQILLRRIQQGDRDAIEYLIERYQRPLFNFAYRFLNDSDAAADICQFVFIQLFVHSPNMHTNEGLKAWLFQVTRNRCLDELRRNHETAFSRYEQEDRNTKGISVLEQIADESPLPIELVEREDIQQILVDAITSLPERYREVVALRYSADLSFAEIGEILGVPESTAKTQFHRAKPLLRAFLHQRGVTHSPYS
jgi:RNA polymerase sigma factor (sigma-70 family)